MLDPAAIAAIEDLELSARLVVEGFRTGQHRSPLHGFSAEFSQYRQYRPGDDLKHLDWKALARTDRLYTRQFRETTNMSVMLVIDTSASMDYPRGGGVTKFQYARVIAAALAYLIVTQGDAVGLMTIDGGRLSYLPARGGRVHLRALIARLGQLTPSGTWRPAEAITRGADLLKRRGVIIALSDFYDDEAETARALRRVARRGHDAAMLQVISRDELAFPFDDDVEFEDAESGERRLVSAATVAREYRAGVADFLAHCRSEAKRDGVDYALFPTDIAPDRALRSYLIKR
ncbi:MAG TPA: DUF58 domain-containing protein [Vicinamibacterales bacterium]|nr:DUF58 domain-containing protein [Vicinamibacterales bacterium]